MSLPLKIGLLLKKNPNRTFHLPTIHFQREDVSFREYVTDYQTWFQQKISIIQFSPSITLLHPQHFWARLQRFSTPKSVAFLEAPKILSPKCPSAASKRWVRRVPQNGRWVLLPQKTFENTQKKGSLEKWVGLGMFGVLFIMGI